VREIEYTQEFSSLSIDVCVGCQLVWLDRGELEALPRTQVLKQKVPRPQPPSATDLALASRDRSMSADVTVNVLDVVTDGLWFITTMFD